MTTLPTLSTTIDQWQRVLYAFLAETHRRAGSLRTRAAYSSQLQHFFGKVGKPPTRSPARRCSPGPTAVGCQARRYPR
jgi:hypothetical protein